MRRVKLFIADSLDGFIARPDGGVDWLFTDGDYGMAAFYKSTDTVLITYKSGIVPVSYVSKQMRFASATRC